MQIESQSPTDVVASYKAKIDESISRFFDRKEEETKDVLSKRVIKIIRDYTEGGGKRLRPIFMILGYRLFSPEEKGIFDASISIELAQSYLLIHDDVIDKSDVRRGKPSMHIRLEDAFVAGCPQSRSTAEGLAIVAGDLAESYAHEALLRSGFYSENLVKADLELSKTIEMTGYGQFLDILSTTMDDFNEGDLIRLHLWKTAKYTLEGPLAMGAILSGTEYDITALREYGRVLGIAFQLKDDILGLFGDEKTIGKSVYSDVNEGKKTLLMIKAMEWGDRDDANFIRKMLRKGNVTNEEFERIKKLVMDTGSYDYSINLMGKLVDKSKEYLAKVSGDNYVKKILDWLSDYLISRDH
ncbi:farnesyl pyrophosphate synthase [Thermoplasma volcanium GSS1]|uniref:Farnesyl pyrophosphate synthase n=1 Tax=Thermoplasma volcanium (strain ATCC 51530 / DSM 4299 / JCM 9571 / NBRC 15438 / GSS1) TaxID=273116 RepID=Q97C41_THEVO|nr:polyprenyl synthetase family protein [Thermoplasma volcanium]BAB59406.1 farnesyl pyrophosphate synthase [Thermoplasma volcanium GSS1]